jgi:beta-glucosidase
MKGWRPAPEVLLLTALVGCGSHSAAGLPQGFLLGAATAAHQVEGGNLNDWTVWEAGRFEDGRPHIRDDARSGRAAGSWELWRDDVQALQTLGANAYRFGLEWSRLMPTPGSWNAAAGERYRAQLQALRAAGTTPFVTLHHFSLPLWLSELGGWEAPEALDAFEAFTRRAAAELGADVDFWVTINEPSVYALYGYATGIWPPGVQDMKRASRVYATLLRAHARAAKALREVDIVDADGNGTATQIGLAHQVLLIQPASSSLLDASIAGLSDDWANEAVPRAARTGRIRLYVPGQVDIDEEVEGLKGSFDYLGLNQYYRVQLRADLGMASLSRLYVAQGAAVNDLGGEIYPEGLYRMLRRFAEYGWPIYVTENGVADAADALRPDFLRGALDAVARAAQDGVDVRG